MRRNVALNRDTPSGQITLVGDVDLSAGDVLGLYYEADGFTGVLELGSNNPPGIIWSIHSLSN